MWLNYAFTCFANSSIDDLLDKSSLKDLTFPFELGADLMMLSVASIFLCSFLHPKMMKCPSA
jgi:hypothetical protein